MARIRYVGAAEVVNAFNHLFHQGTWVEKHKVPPHQVALLAQNPQFEVEGFKPDDGDAAEQAEAKRPVEQRGMDKATAKAALDPDGDDRRG